MARGLLVDYGGVLTTSVLESFAAFCRDEALAPELMRDVFVRAARAPDNIFRRVEIGALSMDEFDRELALLLGEAAGREIACEGLKARLFARAARDEAMWDAIGAARAAGARTALVSNSWGGDDYPIDQLQAVFDHWIISGHVGLRKPDPEIYLLAAERIGVEPRDCVFVDDFRVNIDGAEAVGMTGLHHTDTATTVAKLMELFAG